MGCEFLWNEAPAVSISDPVVMVLPVRQYGDEAYWSITTIMKCCESLQPYVGAAIGVLNQSTVPVLVPDSYAIQLMRDSQETAALSPSSAKRLLV